MHRKLFYYKYRIIMNLNGMKTIFFFQNWVSFRFRCISAFNFDFRSTNFELIICNLLSYVRLFINSCAVSFIFTLKTLLKKIL